MDWDSAKRLVQAVEDAFGAADLARIEQGFRRMPLPALPISRRCTGGMRSCASCAPALLAQRVIG